VLFAVVEKIEESLDFLIVGVQRVLSAMVLYCGLLDTSTPA